jgi:uncharacterized SAM-binding protein YcdF (DUF218 family)
MASTKSKYLRRLILGVLVLVALALSVQLYWVDACLRECLVPPSADAVVVFSGDVERIRSGVELVRTTGARYLVVSREQRRLVEGVIRQEGGLPGVDLFVDDSYATTTDGNARYAAPLLRDFSVQDAALVTDWYHMPRALFLLKVYLGGSAIHLHPYPSRAIPEHPWEDSALQLECFKMWGSVLRVALHKVGVDDWPPNASGLKRT